MIGFKCCSRQEGAPMHGIVLFLFLFLPVVLPFPSCVCGIVVVPVPSHFVYKFPSCVVLCGIPVLFLCVCDRGF